MRFFTLLMVSFICFQAKAQIKNGVYKSVEESFKKNYFLVFEDETVTLYGWAVEYKTKDTVYFLSQTKQQESMRLQFDTFEFSKTDYSSNLSKFKGDSDVTIPTYYINRYFNLTKNVGGRLFFNSVKGMSYGSFDTVIFQMVK